MKDYCKCGGIMDETEFIAFGMCPKCFADKEMKGLEIKHRSIIIRRGCVDYVYVCHVAEWNFYLDRYYPKAELYMEIHHLKPPMDLKGAIGSETKGRVSRRSPNRIA